MNNNQFKKVVRQFIEDECSTELKIYYVDTSNNSRNAYVYDKDFNAKGTIHLYFNEKEVSIEFSLSKEKPVNICNYETRFTANYLELRKIKENIEKMIKAIKEN